MCCNSLRDGDIQRGSHLDGDRWDDQLFRSLHPLGRGDGDLHGNIDPGCYQVRLGYDHGDDSAANDYLCLRLCLTFLDYDE